jgi:NitT/TauT family transport system permease protein
MVEALTRMQTDTLIALMIMAAMVGYAIDRFLIFINRSFTRWRYAD